MQTKLKLVVAVTVGMLVGTVGGWKIHAQQTATPPGYVLAEVDVHDPEMMAKYGAKVPETLAPFNHHYVVLSGKVQPLEGEPPKGGIVMIAFDSVEKAKEWYDSPGYGAVRSIRQSAAKSRIFIVEGVPPK